MFVIDNDKTVYLTRGDMAIIEISISDQDGELYEFKPNDVLRFQIMERNHCETIILRKDLIIDANTTSVNLVLERGDTKIGKIINKPVDYWYEVELNPDTNPQTIIGYDSSGPKLFRLFPEGDDNDGYQT